MVPPHSFLFSVQTDIHEVIPRPPHISVVHNFDDTAPTTKLPATPTSHKTSNAPVDEKPPPYSVASIPMPSAVDSATDPSWLHAIGTLSTANYAGLPRTTKGRDRSDSCESDAPDATTLPTRGTNTSSR
mmetsp:Transcript_10437/g.22411  ORF Transcript_10437/g.22411 Transcript_10437/m.22411 type:complete len:129 (+) Transcript_10437:870-1256(+)